MSMGYSSATFELGNWTVKVHGSRSCKGCLVAGPEHRLDIGFTARGDAPARDRPHGIVGQSYATPGLERHGKKDLYPFSGSYTTSAQAEGAIEGTVSDYEVASPYATEFAFSRFNAARGAPAPAKATDVVDASSIDRVADPSTEAQRRRLSEADGLGEEKGWEIKERPSIDTRSNFEFVDRAAGGFTAAGKLGSMRFYVQNPGSQGFRFRIYRPTQPGQYRTGFKYIGETEEIDTPNVGVMEYTFSQQVPFLPGDYVGWAHTRQGVFPYTDGEHPCRVSWNIGINSLDCDANGYQPEASRCYSYSITTVPAYAGDYDDAQMCGEAVPQGLPEKPEAPPPGAPPPGAAPPPLGAAVADPHC